MSAIFTWHSIDTTGSVISVSPAEFRAQMDWLADSGVAVVPLPQVLQTPGAVALTFDDGFANFATEALPVLNRYRFPATVFAVSGYCGKDNNWPGQWPGLPILPLMDWQALREAASAGIAIGGHTRTHPDLTRIRLEDAASEIKDSRRQLEDGIGCPVKTFAYPYGRSNPAIRRVAAETFALSLGTGLNYLQPADDIHDLPRLDTYFLRGRFPGAFTVPGRALITLRRWARGLLGR